MNVPKLRFKEFTDEWTFTTLKDVAIKVNRVESNNSPIMMISAEKGFILQSQKYSKDMTGDSLKKYITLYKNELAYNHGASKLRPYGSVFMLLEDKARIPFVYHCFKITNGYNKFFSYYLNRYSFGRLLKPLISSTARMDGLLNISFDNYFSIKFKIPQLKEQEKIANLLTTVDKKITNLENTITSLENQKKGLLQQIFSQKLRFKDKNGNNYPNWEKKKLGDIATLKNGISKSNEAFGHGKKFINLQDIFNKSYIFNDNYSLVDVTEKELSENNLLKGDVLFVRSSVKREGVGLPCVIMENLIDTVYSGFIIRCRFNINENIYLHYKKYCFLEFSFRKALLKKSSSSANTNINQDNLSKLYVNSPCLEEQTKIADFLSAFDRKLDNQKAQLEHWKQIKKGLLQQMFV